MPEEHLAERPYNAERLKIAKTQRQAAPLEGLVGSDANSFLHNPVECILKADCELCSLDEVPRPYTDPPLTPTYVVPRPGA